MRITREKTIGSVLPIHDAIAINFALNGGNRNTPKKIRRQN
jgi:hypothetical protein